MKYPAVASLILRTLHTISVLINKKTFLLAHFIIRGAAKMQTHLTGWEFTSVIFPGTVGALGRLGHRLPALPTPPLPAQGLIMDSSCPQAPPRTAPPGATARQTQLTVTPSNPGKFFLVQPLEPFHGSLTHITKLNGKFIFYFLGPCSRISNLRQ